MDYLGNYVKYLILAAAIVGTIMYPHYKHSKVKYFIFIIWYGVFTEFVGAHYYKWFDQPNSKIVFNLYTLVSITFFLWWFGSLLTNKRRRTTIKYFIVVFWIANVLNAIFLLNVLYQSTKYAFVVGVILLVITICYFFIEMFNKEVVLNIRNSIYFWFALGVLLFFATFLPFYVTTNFFNQNIQSLVPLGVAVFVLNIIMNGCFIVGFTKARKSAMEYPLKQGNDS